MESLPTYRSPTATYSHLQIMREEGMPLTKKGAKIKRAMQEQYGKERGEGVFYASQNKGVITGTHKKGGAQKKKK